MREPEERRSTPVPQKDDQKATEDPQSDDALTALKKGLDAFKENVRASLPERLLEAVQLSFGQKNPVSIAIECESPEAISVTDSAGAVLPGSISGNVWTGGEIVQEELGVPLKVTIRSDVPQQITHLTIFSE